MQAPGPRPFDASSVPQSAGINGNARGGPYHLLRGEVDDVFNQPVHEDCCAILIENRARHAMLPAETSLSARPATASRRSANEDKNEAPSSIRFLPYLR